MKTQVKSQNNTETILWVKGTFQRVVRGQRMFKDVRIGAIRDQGYLVLVEQVGDQWRMVRTIRKLKCA